MRPDFVSRVFSRSISAVALMVSLAWLAPISPTVAETVNHDGKCHRGAAWHGSSKTGEYGGASLIPCGQEEPATTIQLRCTSEKPGSVLVHVNYLSPQSGEPNVAPVRLIIDRSAFVMQGKVDHTGMYEVASFEIPDDHPLIAALASGNRGSLQAGRGSQPLMLKGSREAIEVMQAGCSSLAAATTAAGNPLIRPRIGLGQINIDNRALKKLRGECRGNFQAYVRQEGFSAFAFARNGACGYSYGHSSLEEAKSAALSTCRNMRGNWCGIVATRDKLAWKLSESCKAHYETWRQQLPPAAFAISKWGACGWSNTATSLAEAERLALEGCQPHGECRIAAVREGNVGVADDVDQPQTNLATKLTGVWEGGDFAGADAGSDRSDGRLATQTNVRRKPEPDNMTQGKPNVPGNQVPIVLDGRHPLISQARYRSKLFPSHTTVTHACRLRHDEVRKRLQNISLSISEAVVKGEPISLKWDTTQANLPSDQDVFLLLYVPSESVVTGHHNIYGEFFDVLNLPPAGRESRLIQISGNVLGQTHGEAAARVVKGGGEIEILPTGGNANAIAIMIVIANELSGERPDQKRICNGDVLAAAEHIVPTAPAATRWPAPQSCHLSTADRLELSAALENASIQSGEAAVVHWKLKGDLAPDCVAPLYLMLSMPKRVRFEGNGFLALAPGAAGPFGIRHKMHEMRIFIPLNIDESDFSGSVVIKPYQVGELRIRAELVEVPIWRKTPAGIEDFDGRSAVVWPLKEADLSLRVSPGIPEIVIYDSSDTREPDAIVASNSGEFILKQYDGYYRVIDRNTGALVAQRDGAASQFSFTSRFVATFLENRSALEVFDLYAGRVVASFRTAEENIHSRQIDHVAWGSADSFIVFSATAQAGAFVQLLVDGRSLAIDPGAYKRATVSAMEVFANIETLSLLTKQPRYDDGTLRSLLGGTIKPGPATGRKQFRQAYFLGATRKSLFRRDLLRWKLGETTHFIPFEVKEPKRLKAQLDHAAREWRKIGRRFSDSVQIRMADGRSMYSVPHIDLSAWQAEIEGQYYKDLANFEQLPPLMFRHGANSGFQISATKAPSSRLMEGNFLTARLRSIHDHSDGGRLSEHLVGFGRSSPGVQEGKPPRGWSKTWETALQEWERVPSDPGCEDRQAVRWGQFWMVHRRCLGGSGWYSDALLGFTYIDGKQSKIHSLRFEKDGLDSGKFAKAWMSEGILIIAMPNDSVVIFDPIKGERITVLKKLDGTEIPSELRMSEDRSRLLQVNGDGRVAVYDVLSGNRLLLGFTFDDELVLYTDGGHYTATPEGAHFVSLKFPGVPGTYTFHQFEKKLRVPDLVERVLAGEKLPRVDVGVPPSLEVEFGEAVDPARITGRFRKGPFGDIDKVQVYQDGVMTDTIAPSGGDPDIPFDVSRLSGTRWVSLLALDAEGLASQPVSQDLGPDPRGKSRVVTVAVGIDSYADGGIADLEGAASDARGIAEAIAAVAAERSPEPVKLLDQLATRQGIVAALAAAVDAASAGDTLVISYAGHGVRDAAGGYYLTTHDTRLDDIAGTAIPWKDVAGLLRRAKGRVVLLLDACHSGAAGTNFFATNDEAAEELLAGVPANIVIFAASKGRELSYESLDGKGGVFSRAFADVVSRERSAHDLNGNGAIEISELFVGVNRKVVVDGRPVREKAARENGFSEVGTQTPWIARNQMVGDFALF